MKLVYPDLPIVLEKNNIIDALHTHSVVVIAGETGSGKTTQLPKICLEAGLGYNGKIGHTQPRRLAARNVAYRLAEECQVKLGETVGYKVRFSDKTSERTRIQIMTDGILLSEVQQDKRLSAYDCIIIDEAHERSLNIDFLLGYVKNLLTRRTDLKVVITSATIDVERFSQFFDNAPLIQVPGRSYPIEVNYFPPESDGDDPAWHVAKAVELACQRGPGDILIFQSGEREIRELMEVLQALKLPKVHVLPLYARQSTREQQKIFDHYSGRKIIVTTNVAETSLTVPNIRYVIDPGWVRINRYNPRNKLQRLPIEPISQASAEQRKGRCGRVGPGICYRLYTQDDLATRAVFTEPEILRVNLAGVILRMLHLGFRPVERFPLMEPLEPAHVKDGLNLLQRLGAVDVHKKITVVGQQLARIPLEPKFGRMLLAGKERACLHEMLIIVSAISIVDPREWPQDESEKAQASYQVFCDPRSDFLFYLALWNFLFEHKKALSHQKFRLLCRQQYLSYMRVCEWFDVHEQLIILVEEYGWMVNQVTADYATIHQAILSGLLEGVGCRDDKKQYRGMRNMIFSIHPRSALFKQTAPWIVSGEIVHTTKNYARLNAAVEPAWIETIGRAFLKYQYDAPYFDVKTGSVVAFEKVILFGLTLVERRRVHYERIDPPVARDIFIREGLCEDSTALALKKQEFDFHRENQMILSKAREWEVRCRRPGMIVHDEILYNFYQTRVPAGIGSFYTLEKWIQQYGPVDWVLSNLESDQWKKETTDTDEALFPACWNRSGAIFNIEYCFDLTSDMDGATIVVPIEALKTIKEEDFSWPMPGWVADKIAYAIRALPKKERLKVTVIPATIPLAGTFFDSLAAFLKKEYHVLVTAAQLANLVYPAYLSVHFKVIDSEHRLVAEGQDIKIIYDQLKPQLSSMSTTAHPLEKREMKTWEIDTLPQRIQVKQGNFEFTYFPAWVDCETHVRIDFFETEALAREAHAKGLTRLALLALHDTIKVFQKEIQKHKKELEKEYAPFGTVEECKEAILFSAAYESIVCYQVDCVDRCVFEQLLASRRSLFFNTAIGWLSIVREILISFHEVQQKLYTLQKKQPALYGSVIQAIDRQLTILLPRQFIRQTPLRWLKRYPVYLKAILIRLEKFPSRVARDIQLAKEIDVVEQVYRTKKTLHGDIRYLIEEFRISLFAESLKTVEKISKVRLLKILEEFE